MNLDTALTRLAHNPAAPLDIAELALELARDEYPELDVEAYLSELAAMAHEARRYLRGKLEARVTGLCRYLFHEMGFRGNQQEYYDPRNSYLNEVLERRTGIPITLSVVALSVGRRAGLQVEGVGLPGHFIAKAMLDDREVLFDPFHGGRLLSREECEQLVHKVTGQSFCLTEDQLRPVAPGPLAVRMLSNLKAIYLKQEDFGRAIRVIGRLRQLDPDDARLGRDLGICLLQAGRPGKAIDHLAGYVADLPEGEERKMIGEMLDIARSRIAQWN